MAIAPADYGLIIFSKAPVPVGLGYLHAQHPGKAGRHRWFFSYVQIFRQSILPHGYIRTLYLNLCPIFLLDYTIIQIPPTDKGKEQSGRWQKRRFLH
ncbi:hypothetical protein SDC9_166286 [bioreactor metagenome]|uniref:Uncharacterized protein n=1 Tax=bioreactor metagenome TaxID=1076179 RepID=A0A645FWJ1_9ZZZZ